MSLNSLFSIYCYQEIENNELSGHLKPPSNSIDIENLAAQKQSKFDRVKLKTRLGIFQKSLIVQSSSSFERFLGLSLTHS